MGHPRVKGQKLASPQEVVAQTPQRRRLTVTWDGGGTRDIEVVTGTGHGYRIGEDLVEVCWVYVHDGTGTHRDEYLFSTDVTMPPQQIVECYTQRWSIETTFQECREYLKLESTKGYSQANRFTIHAVLTGIIYRDCPALSPAPKALENASSSLLEGKIDRNLLRSDDVCTASRMGAVGFSHTGCFQEFSKLSLSLQETILYALAPAA